MSRKKRGILAVAAVVGLLVATEIGLNILSGPSATVQIDNLGVEPIEGLEVSAGLSRDGPAKVDVGGSIRFQLRGTDAQTLFVKFRQRGNPLNSYELPGFDPALMHTEGSRLILQIRANEIIRFQDEAEPRTVLGRASHYLRHKAWHSLTREYIPW